MCHDSSMPNMNIRQLRDTRKLKAWLQAGKTVELRADRVLIILAELLQERGHRVTLVGVHFSPAVLDRFPEQTCRVPDFSARRKSIFGDRVLPGADLLIEERGRY